MTRAHDPHPLAGRAVLVAGGTGNVGRHVVRALLERGAVVVVPSRDPAKLEGLRARVGADVERLQAIAGDLGDERDALRVRAEVERRLPAPLDGVVASLGRFVPVPSPLAATRGQLLDVLESYVVAHFVVARTFLPALAERGGSYTLVNGPSAFAAWPGSAFVSAATAAQAMLARALAADPALRERVRITDLVIHPSRWIGPDDAEGYAEALDGAALDGRAVGRYVAALVAGRVPHGTPVHLESPAQLADVA